MKKANAQQMRRLEALAVEQGDSYIDLMERAGEAVVTYIEEELWGSLASWKVTVVCGHGNNGGDGFVIAARLARLGQVTLILGDGDVATPTAQYWAARLPEQVAVLRYEQEPYLCGAAIKEAALVVDCLYGIGFHGQLPEKLLPLLTQMNSAAGYKLAVDMPSGVSADTGEAAKGAFAADCTLTFTAPKLGQDSPLCGRVRVLPIGIPEWIVERVLVQGEITLELVQSCFRPRPLDSHKGTFGRALCVCGSYGMAGAALLCGRGALRSGAGLLEMALPRSVYPLLAAALPEAVFHPMAETADGQFSLEAEEALLTAANTAGAVVAGCGLGKGDHITALVQTLLAGVTCPLILDADGINAITPHMLLEETASCGIVLTPHPGEMARLLGISIQEVQQHRREIARRFADEYGVVLVLKGHHTLVTAPGRPLLENPTGNPGMATGGSGDVLAGMIAGLTAQGMEPYHAALCGVYLHGEAGDRAAARLSQHGMLPSDLLEELGGLFLNLEK